MQVELSKPHVTSPETQKEVCRPGLEAVPSLSPLKRSWRELETSIYIYSVVLGKFVVVQWFLLLSRRTPYARIANQMLSMSMFMGSLQHLAQMLLHFVKQRPYEVREAPRELSRGLPLSPLRSPLRSPSRWAWGRWLFIGTTRLGCTATLSY